MAKPWSTAPPSSTISTRLVGRDRALTPPAGADRRAVLRVAALMMGACDKGLHAAYERNPTIRRRRCTSRGSTTAWLK